MCFPGQLSDRFRFEPFFGSDDAIIDALCQNPPQGFGAIVVLAG